MTIYYYPYHRREIHRTSYREKNKNCAGGLSLTSALKEGRDRRRKRQKRENGREKNTKVHK